MLVRLFGENFRSFRDYFELSMVAADLNNEEDRDRGYAEVNVEGSEKPLRLLRTAAILGPNASGKSAICTAAEALRFLIKHSSPKFKPDESIAPYEPFLLDESKSTDSVTLGCMVLFENRILEYKINFHEKNIQSETLTLHGKETETLIDRRATGEITGTLIENSDANKLYVMKMQPNVAVISKLAQHGPSEGPESAIPYQSAILKSLTHKDVSNLARRGKPFHDKVAELAHKDGKFREWMLDNIIIPADVGISDMNIEELDVPDEIRQQLEDLPDDFSPQIPKSVYQVSYVHTGSRDRELDFGDESAGTRKLHHLSPELWKLAKEKVTLFADEFCASLHPVLVDAIVRSLNTKAESPASQLIFTTHDSGLFEKRDGTVPVLRRDQVFFAEKNSEGVSSIFSLDQFKNDARKEHNLRKRYLSGRYGALPIVGGMLD